MQRGIEIYETREEMGARAAADVAAEIRACLQRQRGVRMIFAAAPSQSEMLHALQLQQGIDWPRVTAFHMDEYLGLPDDAPQRFGLWLRREMFDALPFGQVHLLEPGGDAEQAAADYAALLQVEPIDIVCLGIGANGHLAFNDPPGVFDDPLMGKVVELDLACRQQQVDDQCFAKLDDVPTRALTVTIPGLMRGKALFCCVPGAIKREAVQRAVVGELDAMCPASVLRLHPRCKVYLDAASAGDLRERLRA